uniref:DUF4283 domain-containing protein n=1 Tax=Elaeophora elaphi TaxID=1147741 RepID=A0A0R3RQ04_9BILA
MGNSEISSPLVLNERPGVRYLCCDRFFKCDGRNLIAREIWPSDGGSIELNQKELKRFIMNNETKRLNESQKSRRVAGRSSLECSTDNKTEHIRRDDSALPIESKIQSYRRDLYEVHQYKGKGKLSEFNSAPPVIVSDENVKRQQQLHMRGNFAQVTANMMPTTERKDEHFRDTSSQISTISITESPETLISSETTGLVSPTADEWSADENETSIGSYNSIQIGGDQLVPSMKPDGTIVIPGVVHVNNFESLNGVVLELKVLIKSPDESRRINVKIDCPDFKPKSVEVNGIETHRLTNDHYKTP